jgi:H+/Cl- antiporter ClcA
MFTKGVGVVGQFFKERVSFKPLIPLYGGILIIAMFLALDYFGLNGESSLERSKYLGLGLPTISAAFTESLPWYDWLFKLIFTSVTLGTLFKGGEVTPLFFIGATLGNALVIILPLPVSFLAAIGFVGVFAGAANTPIATTLMAIELFGGEIGIYAGVASVVAYLFSGHSSIYSSQKIGISKSYNSPDDQGKRVKEV